MHRVPCGLERAIRCGRGILLSYNTGDGSVKLWQIRFQCGRSGCQLDFLVCIYVCSWKGVNTSRTPLRWLNFVQ